MRILIVNSSTEGGAFVAAKRLYESLKSSQSLSVDFCTPSDAGEFSRKLFSRILAKVNKLLEIFLLGSRPKNNVPFTLGLLSYSPIFSRKKYVDTDVVNLHWLGQGFISLSALNRLRKPVVITMHDSWFLTGGCHLPGTCTQFMTGCQDCPLFTSERAKILVKKMFQKKRKFYKQNRVFFISPSDWLNNQLISSAIYVGKDYDKIYNVVSKEWQNQILPEYKLAKALFVALNPFHDLNKNFPLSLEIVDAVNKQTELELLVIGDNKIPGWAKRPYLKALPIQRDGNTLRSLFATAQYIFCTSKQENLPTVIIEGAHLGTKAIATQVGGIPELTDKLEEMIVIDEANLSGCVDEIVAELRNRSHANESVYSLKNKAHMTFDERSIRERYIATFEKVRCQ